MLVRDGRCDDVDEESPDNGADHKTQINVWQRIYRDYGIG